MKQTEPFIFSNAFWLDQFEGVYMLDDQLLVWESWIDYGWAGTKGIYLYKTDGKNLILKCIHYFNWKYENPKDLTSKRINNILIKEGKIVDDNISDDLKHFCEGHDMDDHNEITGLTQELIKAYVIYHTLGKDAAKTFVERVIGILDDWIMQYRDIEKEYKNDKENFVQKRNEFLKKYQIDYQDFDNIDKIVAELKEISITGNVYRKPGFWMESMEQQFADIEKMIKGLE